MIHLYFFIYISHKLNLFLLIKNIYFKDIFNMRNFTWYFILFYSIQ